MGLPATLGVRVHDHSCVGIRGTIMLNEVKHLRVRTGQAMDSYRFRPGNAEMLRFALSL